MSEEFDIDPWNNFVRVFEIPQEFPSGFYFGGGRLANFQMKDWFQPFPSLPQPSIDKRAWIEKEGEFMTLLYTGDQVRESKPAFDCSRNSRLAALRVFRPGRRRP